MPHIPVLLNEVMEILKPQKGEFFIDATFGRGGHSEKILEAIGKEGMLLAIDWDKKAAERNSRFLENENVIFVNANYAGLKDILKKKNLPKADGLLMDLGFSSDQLEDSGKGFSFRRNEPLLMSYGEGGLTAREVVNSYSEEKLARIIRDMGEEKFAGRIARNIVEQRKIAPIETSFRLADIVRKSVPNGYERGRIDPATRTFQALRIYVNGELENLKTVLGDLGFILKEGGRAAIISFHSLEDRVVKNYFRELKRSGIAELLNKKVIMASREEAVANPRSRSAKLRGIVIKINK
ncbi:MAG: 16S rRNA (cytosine(1402)-N(4))-methyltransferase RsmH [Patescibacteria group bacterium]|nr:16S rRNA (cytosine(1402)-N(4))-methyltransferase RsmH [Patescibacteria group bacterium]